VLRTNTVYNAEKVTHVYKNLWTVDEDFQILASKEYGASYALLELAKELGLAPCSLLAQRSLGTGLPGDDRRTHRLRLSTG
jgi:hypothetical protein